VPGILFMEAKNSVLMQRYATTRRPHPLEREGLGLEQAIAEEKSRLAVFKDQADLVIDSSSFSIHDLRRAIQKKWQLLQENAHGLKVHLISFGFKYGTPSEADMVFDLRFLPNPYFVPELRPLSGLDAPIAEYVLGQEPGATYIARFKDFLLYQLPLFEAEGRYRLTIAIGCTGGRHRSVAVTQAVTDMLKEQGYAVSTEHRHLELG
ncbi:RNase adaptor protein RapZ, partial [Desulfovibrio sp. OttesenSCG-928-I05]|nr:RNase adaptor protein RapZ [Desulfovibrio sp. OttesenSCG-928-I05]